MSLDGSADNINVVLVDRVAKPASASLSWGHGLGTDSRTLRSPMKRLAAAGQIKTKGERRGMQYRAG
jgi:hypothetical protein